jgi:hypothetical protein
MAFFGRPIVPMYERTDFETRQGLTLTFGGAGMCAEFCRGLISGLCDLTTAAYRLSWQQQQVETEVG